MTDLVKYRDPDLNHFFIKSTTEMTFTIINTNDIK